MGTTGYITGLPSSVGMEATLSHHSRLRRPLDTSARPVLGPPLLSLPFYCHMQEVKYWADETMSFSPWLSKKAKLFNALHTLMNFCQGHCSFQKHPLVSEQKKPGTRIYTLKFKNIQVKLACGDYKGIVIASGWGRELTGKGHERNF